MSIIKINVYTTRAHKKPFVDWLDSLDTQESAAIVARLARVIT